MADHRWPSPHHNSVPEFQLSGIPYAKSTSVEPSTIATFTFDYLTRWIAISSDQDVQLGFSDNNVIHGTYYFLCKAGMTQRFELKCKKIVIKNPLSGSLDAGGNYVNPTANVSVLAGLTNINSATFPDQKNDNGFKVQ